MSRNDVMGRLMMKNDTPDVWERVSDSAQVSKVFVPLMGEPIFYRVEKEDGTVVYGQKIGDGVHTAEELPFAAANQCGHGFKMTPAADKSGLVIDIDEDIVFVFDAGTSTENLSTTLVEEANEAGGTTAVIS